MKQFIINITTGIMVTALAGCYGDGGSSSSSTEPIKIGLLLAFSGNLVCSGNYEKGAALLAADEINAAGGIFGRQIEIVAEDDETDPDKGVAAANRLVSEGVSMIIGAQTSSTTIKVFNEVCAPNNILMISPTSTSTEISNINDNGLLWRTTPSDEYQGHTAADYAYTTMGKTTAAIIYVNNAYGSSLAASFKARFEQVGGTILQSVPYPEMTDSQLSVYNFTNEVSTLMTGTPQLIYLISYYLDGAKITTYIAANSTYSSAVTKPVLMGGDGNYGSVFLANSVESVIEGMAGIAPGAPVDDSNYQLFALNFKAKYQLAPPLYTANTYDAVYLIAYAMLSARSSNAVNIAAKLQDVSSGGETVNVADFQNTAAKIKAGADINYNGASGSCDFNANGDVTNGTFVVWNITENSFVSSSTISYSSSTIKKIKGGIKPSLVQKESKSVCNIFNE